MWTARQHDLTNAVEYVKAKSNGVVAYYNKIDKQLRYVPAIFSEKDHTTTWERVRFFIEYKIGCFKNLPRMIGTVQGFKAQSAAFDEKQLCSTDLIYDDILSVIRIRLVPCYPPHNKAYIPFALRTPKPTIAHELLAIQGLCCTGPYRYDYHSDDADFRTSKKKRNTTAASPHSTKK